MKSERKLTPLQEAFVVALPKVDWVGTDAVIKAGFQVSKRKSAAEIASQLLKKTQVRAAVDRMMEERLQRAGIYAERVLLELGKIGFSDISLIYKKDGTVKDPKDWPEELKGVIAGVETLEEFEGQGKDRKWKGYTKKIRTYDKVRALEFLGKHLKLLPTERGGEDGGPTVARPLTDMEVSAKIVFLVQMAIKKQQEHERKKVEG